MHFPDQFSLCFRTDNATAHTAWIHYQTIRRSNQIHGASVVHPHSLTPPHPPCACVNRRRHSSISKNPQPQIRSMDFAPSNQQKHSHRSAPSTLQSSQYTLAPIHPPCSKLEWESPKIENDSNSNRSSFPTIFRTDQSPYLLASSEWFYSTPASALLQPSNE